MADLAHQCRNYQVWGVMALWDIYLDDADEWTVKQGFSIWAFIRQLPRLLDRRGWKLRADEYAKKLIPPPPPAIADLLSGNTLTKKPKHPYNQSRFDWLKANKTIE